MLEISHYSDYLGVAIGFVALIIASFLLPAKIRTHVLTAGVSLLIFRTYQLYSNNKKLKRADQEWQKLQANHNELKQRLLSLQQETEAIRAKKVEIEQDLNSLKAEKKRLELSADQDLQRKQQLDERIMVLTHESDDVMLKRQKNIEALRAIAAFNRQITNELPDDGTAP
ncbi:hypothetical protein [Neptunicella sp. SCSIO 80796]|uniref:hypothetical protein n=1 Tax=Neptunicella plasticusilytica TaxID=3117012 RepID=UPI003A4E2ABC